MTDFTSRAATLDDVATAAGTGDITRRASTADSWATITGEPMRTLDDLQTTGGAEPEPPARPTARFTFAPAAPTVGEPVTFDASTSTGEIERYGWQATSGETAEGAVAEITFATAGSRMMVLTAEGPGGRNSVGDQILVEAGEGERAARPKAE